MQQQNKKEKESLVNTNQVIENKVQNLLPYIIHIKNLTDEKLYDVDLFNYEHDKQKKIEYSCSQGVPYENFLRQLASQNKASELITKMRFSAYCDYPKYQVKQLCSYIKTIITKSNGSSKTNTIHIQAYMSAYQQQSNIIEVTLTDEQKFEYSNQLQLRLDYLMPEAGMTIFLFPVNID
jgi:hypothetical protein